MQCCQANISHYTMALGKPHLPCLPPVGLHGFLFCIASGTLEQFDEIDHRPDVPRHCDKRHRLIVRISLDMNPR